MEHRVEGETAARSSTSSTDTATRRGPLRGTKNRKEGVVVRPLRGARSETLGGRLSFKVISNELLLKDED